MSAADLCRMHGISDATFYTWRSIYGGMEVLDARKLKALDEENRIGVVSGWSAFDARVMFCGFAARPITTSPVACRRPPSGSVYERLPRPVSAMDTGAFTCCRAERAER